MIFKQLILWLSRLSRENPLLSGTNPTFMVKPVLLIKLASPVKKSKLATN
ncbi:MAG: hypothetical protein AABX52_03870 [Nanoarchaeota archaeon]